MDIAVRGYLLFNKTSSDSGCVKIEFSFSLDEDKSFSFCIDTGEDPKSEIFGDLDDSPLEVAEELERCAKALRMVEAYKDKLQSAIKGEAP